MVVVDSSVIIHLSRIGKLRLLKDFFGKIRITKEVYDEIKEGTGASEVEEACENWIDIQATSESQSGKLGKLEGIEKADVSVILLASENKDIILSNDYALMAVGRSKGIECWWLTTLLIRCMKKSIIAQKDARQLLFELVQSGMRLSNDVYAAILKKIDDYPGKN